MCAASVASRRCAPQGSAAAGQRGVDLLAGPGPPEVGGAAAGLSGRQLGYLQSLLPPQVVVTVMSGDLTSVSGQ